MCCITNLGVDILSYSFTISVILPSLPCWRRRKNMGKQEKEHEGKEGEEEGKEESEDDEEEEDEEYEQEKGKGEEE